MLISKSSSIAERAIEPSMSALKYLRPEKAETPWFAVGSIRLACNWFVPDHHRIQVHSHRTGLVFLSRFGSLARTLIERCEYISLNVLQHLVRKRWRSLRDRPCQDHRTQRFAMQSDRPFP